MNRLGVGRAGATIPLLGFGNMEGRWQGEAVGKDGILGLLQGSYTPPFSQNIGVLDIWLYCFSTDFKPKRK